MPRVICAGHVNWDVTLRVDRLPPVDGEARITDRWESAGGSAANAASVLSGLGVAATVLGSVGRDERGAAARRELEASGVETCLVEAADRPTSEKYLVVGPDGEVMVLGGDGANEAFEPTDLPGSALASADRLHLTSQEPETAARLAKRAADAGTPVSFDPGRRLGDREYGDALDHADLLFCNEREIDVASESGLLDDVPTVVVKRGADGATVRTDDGTISHPGFAVDAVDTTGAGDAFAAGFIAARFSGSDEFALSIGNACGALAVQQTGPRLRIEWDDVQSLVDVETTERPTDRT